MVAGMSRWFPDALPPTPLERFLFDLNGFIIVEGVLSAADLAEGNAMLDELQHLPRGQWRGHVHAHGFAAKDGLNLQQISEAGGIWERLIDHPAYIEKIRTFVGGEDSFDYHHGPLYIDEHFANLREQGQAIPAHSGGFEQCTRTLYRLVDGRFHCSQVNVLIAWRDIGPGDGATIVVPASHKSLIPHPQLDQYHWEKGQAADGLAGSTEVHLRAGSALIFTDAIMHGSAARRNPGQRRISVYRYGPSWGRSHHPYRPSRALLARLTPTRRALIEPQAEILAPPEP